MAADRRFTFIDGLRGLAALSVVLYHAQAGHHLDSLMAVSPAWAAPVLHAGALGVAVFFVLSGFVIAHSVYAHAVTPAFIGRFMLRRSLRLDPPYWAAMALAVAFAMVSAMKVPGKPWPQVSLAQVAAHVLYLQELLGLDEINSVFWTLTYEVQFYLVYILILGITRNNPALPFQGRATMVAMGVATWVSLAWPPGIVTAAPWPGSFLTLWYGFLLGVHAYWAWRNPRLKPIFLSFAIFILAAGAAHSDGFAIACALTALVLSSAASSGAIYRALNWRWLQGLGAISYSLYLTHNPITGAVFRLGRELTGDGAASDVLWWLVSTAACIGVASLIWWLIEKPSMALARRVALRPSQAGPAHLDGALAAA